jgi:two-component system, OmpR family, phosphate regulon sensor histidine kinase PhoR
MKIPFLHNSLIIFLAIGLIVVSTATLSFVSYHYAVGRENLTEIALDQSNNKLATQHVDRIEQKIVDNDLILSEMIDVNVPKKWPEMVEAIKKADLNVEQVYFLHLDSNYPIYPLYSHEIKNQWGAFRSSFNGKELDVENLIPGQPHHLHKERPNNYFFATYILKETDKGERILVCYQMNFDKILELLDVCLRDLQDKFYVSIMDFDNNGIYGQPLSRSSKTYEARFQTTLYKWILQIMPRNYTELEMNAKNERLSRLFFITLSMLLTCLSLAIIYVGWRHDRQLRQLKESFISNVSHELKTPLSLIRMFSEMLATDRVKNESKKQEYYRILYNESDRMSRLINNLLDFANLVRGIEHKHFEKTNIGHLVTKALEAYRYEAEKDGFQLSVTIADDIADTYADPNAITMAFLNLLDNSAKYAGNRKEIRVNVEQKDGIITLTVADEGLGIPLSEQSKIFDKFYRVNDPSIRRVRGSGIGLAITKHVAEMHGGKVTVSSEPGKGSTFALIIPVHTAPAEAQS